MNAPFNDTVPAAQADPDAEQPYASLGLKDDEYARIKDILGRRPTDAELAMYSVMWSEHCSYKSSKVHLRYFGETTTPEMNEKILAGIGENAGVVDIGNGHAVTFRRMWNHIRVPPQVWAALCVTLWRWVHGQ